jgi:hypothetical protein
MDSDRTTLHNYNAVDCMPAMNAELDALIAEAERETANIHNDGETRRIWAARLGGLTDARLVGAYVAIADFLEDSLAATRPSQDARVEYERCWMCSGTGQKVKRVLEPPATA